MTQLTKLFEKSCNVFATTKKTNSLLCRSATKRRPRRLQVACAVDRRTAAELQDQSPTDPPTHRYTCQHPAIIHTDRHAGVAVTDIHSDSHSWWATRPVTDQSTYTQIHMPAPSNYTHRQTCSDSHSWWATRPVTDRSTHTQIHTPALSNYTHRQTDRSRSHWHTQRQSQLVSYKTSHRPIHPHTDTHASTQQLYTQTDMQWQSQLVSH